jgi:hypothetical protein
MAEHSEHGCPFPEWRNDLPEPTPLWPGYFRRLHHAGSRLSAFKVFDA